MSQPQLVQRLLSSPGGKDRPDALEVAGEGLSDGQLAEAAAKVAADFAGASRVALRALPRAETVTSVIGLLQAGATVIPVPADAGEREVAHILGDSGSELFLEAAPGEASRVIDLGAPGPREREHPALILYTSGTTGPPKGVPISSSAIVYDIEALAEAWAWGEEDTLAHGLPLFHVHGLVLGVLGARIAGSRLVHTGRPTPEGYAAAAGRGATLMFGVPTVWSRIAAEQEAGRALRGTRLLVSGSASLPRPVEAALKSLCGKAPIERYGMTETLITLAARAADPVRTGWVGGPVRGTQARLVDEAGSVVEADGETVASLEVRGPGVMAGYLGRPEATAESFAEGGWFKTGDAAVATPEGQFRIVGREKSDLIKTGGYRVGAGEIEDVLLEHPMVRQAAVKGVEDRDLGQVIVAWVVAEGAGSEQLIEWVSARLSRHKRPRRVHLVEDLPRNAMGKIQKPRLEEP